MHIQQICRKTTRALFMFITERKKNENKVHLFLLTVY